MKTSFKLLGLVAVFALAFSVVAADKDDAVTVKGTIGCAKCQGWDKDLKECNIAIKGKDKDGKDVIYYFDADGTKKYMSGDSSFCKRKADGEVTGTVTEKDGKKWIKVDKLTENK